MFRYLSLGFLLWLAAVLTAQAQIIDDSTRNEHTSKGIRQFTAQDISEGRYALHPLDTVLTDAHNERRWFHDSVYYQTLEVFGTAARPLLWQAPREIGIRHGKHAFDLYAYHPGQIRYYDSRSPYSNLRWINGYSGFSLIEASINRNIRPWWNAGLSFQRITSDRQIGVGSLRQQAQVDGIAVEAQSSLRSESGRYRVLLHFTNFNHRVSESGGVLGTANTDKNTLFDFSTEPVNLSNATNRDIRNEYGVSQQFQVMGEGLKLFHEFTRNRQVNRFYDLLSVDTSGNVAFYNRTGDSTQFWNGKAEQSRTNWLQFQNMAGVKGNWSRFSYTLYGKRRDVEAKGWAPEALTFQQNFLGGELRTRLLDSLHVWANAEQLLGGSNDSRAQAGARYRFLNLRLMHLSRQPDLTQQRYSSDLFNWQNNFKNTTIDQVEAGLRARFFYTGWELSASYALHQNYVDYGPDARPVQFTEQGQIMQLHLRTRSKFGKVGWANWINLNQENGPEVARLPQYFLNTRLYYEGSIFKKALLGQVGFEGRYWAPYYAKAYMPATQQFYLQNDFRVESYPLVDFFINADINTFTLFLKVNNILQDLVAPGYFITPYYPGYQRAFSFGIQWQFYD